MRDAINQEDNEGCSEDVTQNWKLLFYNFWTVSFNGSKVREYEIVRMVGQCFFYKAPSFKAREAHWYLNNRLGIFRARGGGLLDHPYAPCHPPLATPMEKHHTLLASDE